MRILQKTVLQQIRLPPFRLLLLHLLTYQVSQHLSFLQTLPKHLLKKEFQILKFCYFFFIDQTSATNITLVDGGTNVSSSLVICFGLINWQVSLKNLKYVAVILKLL